MKKTALIVAPKLPQIVTNVIKELGMDALLALHPIEALQYAHENSQPESILICDAELPDMPIMEFLEIYRNKITGRQLTTVLIYSCNKAVTEGAKKFSRTFTTIFPPINQLVGGYIKIFTQ